MSISPGLKKKPCRICRKWFLPDTRPGKRQKTCGNSKCKKKWHAKKCAEWNKKNQTYFSAAYLDKKLSEVSEKDSKAKTDNNGKIPSPSVSSVFGPRLPYKEIQEIMGAKELVVMDYMGRLLYRRVQEVIMNKGIL